MVAVVLGVMPPATSSATPDVRAGAATPNERVNVWDFDDASDEYLDFLCQRKGSGAIGLTVRFKSSATTATSGAALTGAAIRRFADDAEDLDSTAHSYDFNYQSVTAPSASGEVTYDSIAFTDGADMDSLADGELFILRFTRDGNGTNGTDDMSGDFELWADSIVIEET